MMGMVVNESELKHLGIRCRCGERSIAKVPPQLVRAFNLHVCKCGAIYVVRMRDGQWQFQRAPDDTMDSIIAVSPDVASGLLRSIVEKLFEEKVGEKIKELEEEKKPLVN